ncbi:L,D-transpeptidase family protein [Thiohalocapsa halophila]|nr:L,D-transpeptidase family protein [Thiohalocapsa halophila]
MSLSRQTCSPVTCSPQPFWAQPFWARPFWPKLGDGRITALALAAVIAMTALLGGCASPPEPSVRFVDSVLVRKGERTLQLLHNGDVYREYKIALGDSPEGHKFQEGDERTPEGDYMLNWRNPNSSFHKSIHISYPNHRDRAFARAIGVDPGGMIMIHGRPNWLTSPAVAREYDNRDWTDGCIAVKNHEMDEIWRLVRDGTPIRILP